MKIFMFLISCAIFFSCSNTQKISSNCYKGRLEIKGICANYTIKLLEGKVDNGAIASSWTNEQTGKTYSDVFSLVNPCVLPAEIKEGEEFYFTITPSQDKTDCVTCMAYYPTPDKKLNIKMLNQPCSN